MPSRIQLSVLAALSAVALAACTDSAATAPSPTSPTEDPPTSTSSEESSTEAPAGDTTATPGGTKLKFGEQAVVPYNVDEGTVGITVTAIQPGDQAAFEQQFGENAKGTVPFYVKYTVTNVGGTDLSDTTLAALYGSTVPGETTTGVALIGEMPGCESIRSPEDFTAAGATYESCELVAAPAGESLAEVGYEEDDYEENPIVWTP
jgi:hypothetical protein